MSIKYVQTHFIQISKSKYDKFIFFFSNALNRYSKNKSVTEKYAYKLLEGSLLV